MTTRELPALEASLEHIRAAPRDEGRLELIVARPGPGERDVLDEAQLDVTLGLVGDRWDPAESDEPWWPETALTIMNARATAAIAGEREHWPGCGDQLYVDFDLSTTHLPPGSRLEIGSAVVEITTVPHRGCGKFTRRYGVPATKFVNSPAGRDLNVRGVNARVITAGIVTLGAAVTRLSRLV